MPLRFLRGHYGRLALTVVALACGVAQVCATDLVGDRVGAAFTQTIDTLAGQAALQVVAGEGAAFPAAVADTVAAVSGVTLAAPVVSATAFAADDSGELLTVQGIDFGNDSQRRIYDLTEQTAHGLDDPHLLLPTSVILTRSFAARHGLAKGDAVVLETPKGRRTFRLRGVLDPKGVARVYGGNLAVMDLYGAADAFVAPAHINRIDVVIPPDADVDATAAAIRAVLPDGLQVETPRDRKADLNRVIRSFRVMLSAVGMIGVIGAFLIGFNRLSTVFEARAWQIGVLKAVGVRRAAVWRELMKESLMLGAAGVLTGIPLGVWVARQVAPLLGRTAALAFNWVAPRTEATLQPSSLLLATAVGMASAVLAAALPAWRAARVPIAQTLRSRGLEQRALAAYAHWGLRAALVVGVIVAIAHQAIGRSVGSGFVASALICIAVVAASGPCLRLAGAPLTALSRSLLGAAAGFAVAEMTRSARRSALTVATAAVGLGAVLWLWVIAGSFEESVVQSLLEEGAMRVDFVVSSAHIASGFKEAPVDDALVGQLKAIPGIVDAVGERVADWHYAGGPIAIEAFDQAFFGYVGGADGSFPGATGDWRGALGRGEAVLVSSNFAHNLQVGTGDTVRLDTPSGPLTFPVMGVVNTFSSPRGTLWMGRETYRRYWRDAQITRAFVRTAPDADRAAVQAAIARSIGRTYGLRILSARELVEYFSQQVGRAFAGLHVLAAVVLGVVFVGVADTLAANVTERTRHFGAMRAMGIRRRQLRRMVMIEGLVLGTVGLVLASIAGSVLGALWVEQTFPLLMGWVIAFHVPYASVALVVIATVAICVLAALLPAQRAARLVPAIALREE